MSKDNVVEIPEGATWVKVVVQGFKLHFCPSHLAAHLVVDLISRDEDAKISSIEEADEGFIDLPGMIMADRPIEDILVDGFKLSIPSQDFAYYAAKLAQTPVRFFQGGQEYHKIHGWLSCVVVTPEQRIAVLQSMSDMLDDVKRRAAEADEEFQRRMDKVNEGKERVVSWRDKKRVVKVSKPKPDQN